MTENEKLFLNENARIYHVGRPAPVRKKRSRSIVFCATAAVVLALWEAPDNGHFTDMMRIAAQASAGVELMCFDGIFSGNSTGASPADNANIANEAEKNVNNISETILPSDEDDILMLSKGSRRMPSSADEESLVEDFLPEPADSGTPAVCGFLRRQQKRQDNPDHLHGRQGGELHRPAYGRSDKKCDQAFG